MRCRSGTTRIDVNKEIGAILEHGAACGDVNNPAAAASSGLTTLPARTPGKADKTCARLRTRVVERVTSMHRSRQSRICGLFNPRLPEGFTIMGCEL